MSTLQQCLTARDGGAPWRTSEFESKPTRERGVASILIDPRVTYQKVIGFGGAFTEAGAVTLQKMPVDKQEEIIQAYFGEERGLGYTLCRTHINSCDFALGNYAYSEKDGDFELAHFSIERDRTALIPFIKRAQKASRAGLTLFASPWSPPAWMKTTGAMNQGGRLRADCRDSWARYYARFIQEYAKEQIPIWGLTVQNEPDSAQTWDSCLYSGDEERDFVRDHLGPVLEKSGLGDVKIMIWDHNRDLLYERAKAVLDDPAAARYVWGTAFHWYVTDTFDNVQRVHDAWPDKHLIFSEGCQEGGPHLGEWTLGERYARSMIQDLSHWTEGWVDWNLLLDETGGPNHVGNLCSAPILAHTSTGEVHYQPSYYFIGHFSKFIRPGATRLLSAGTSDQLEHVAFRNPDGLTAVVILNRSETQFRFELRHEGQAWSLAAPQRSIQTLIF